MAPQTIGTPDYVKRFGVSGATLFSVTWANDTNHVSAVIDSNGFPAVIMSDHNTSTVDNVIVGLTWYQDAAGTIVLQTTPWVPAIGGSVALHIPVLSRYFTVTQFNLAGADGTTSTINIYGTSLPFVDISNQNKHIPICSISQSIAAAAIVTQPFTRTITGEAMITIDQGTNNKWTAWLDYWDASALNWIPQLWTARGPDKGVAWSERIILPAAPVRANLRNDDTVSHSMKLYVVGM